MKPLTLSRRRPDGTVEEVEAAKLWAELDELRARLATLDDKSMGRASDDAAPKPTTERKSPNESE